MIFDFVVPLISEKSSSANFWGFAGSQFYCVGLVSSFSYCFFKCKKALNTKSSSWDKEQRMILQNEMLY